MCHDIIGKRVFDTWWVNIWTWFGHKYVSERRKRVNKVQEHESTGY